MKIDLHIHTRTGSDGNLSIEEVFEEAKLRGVELLSITDHDSADCQAAAISLARGHGISYITGVELNVTFQYPGRKSVSLDFLGYQYDIDNRELKSKLRVMKDHRERRARLILDNLNAEFDKEGMERFTEEDLGRIQDSVDGAFGRPHIANYLIEKGIVKDKQEAFARYLGRCDVPKYPLSLAEASRLIRNAGGILVLAHPNDPNGTSLVSLTRDLEAQTRIIEEHMLGYIDGVECWHSRHDPQATRHYIEFAGKHSLIMTGGSDCHQAPVLIGTLGIPGCVAGQFVRWKSDEIQASAVTWKEGDR
ncbi:PHP domain-containing protein [Dehalococcoidia bacterium]|nr:PHP domain-containing protein [Dehalococcoidia bacterium]